MFETTKRMPPIHPGEILLEDFLNPMQISQNRLALDTGMPQSRIQAIVAGKRSISADTAIRLSAYFRNSAEFWLNAQSLYELQLAEYSGEKATIVARVIPYLPKQLHRADSVPN
ncbi:MAG: HigA family addiction module antitoxin [Pseudomonadota bacterium]